MKDDDFSDDDATLDGLDEGELRALEEEAFGTTQQVLQIRQQQQTPPQQPPPKRLQQFSSHSSRQQRPATLYPRGPQAPFKPPRPSASASAFAKPQGYVSYSQQQQQQQQQQQGHGLRQQCQAAMQQHEHQREPPLDQLLLRCRQLFEEEPTLPVATATATVPEASSNSNNPEKPSSDYGDIEGFEETAELWDTPAPAVIGAGGEAREYPVVGGGADIYPPTQHQHQHRLEGGGGEEREGEGEGEEWIGQQEEPGQIVDDVVMGNDANAGADWPVAAAANPAADAEREAFRVQAAELQLRIEQYEKTLLAKNGEVAILRDQKDQQRREWDRKMAQLTNAHGEEKEKIRAECELLRVARDQTQTELLFVMKERDDAVRRERAIARKVHQSTQEVLAPAPTSQEPAAALAAARNEGPSTPRHKDRSYAFRDGFEDDDVLMASPSKRGGAKTRTPTKTGLKRKRSVNGSPLPQLHLSQSRSASVATERVPTIDDKVLEKLFAQDDRLEFFEAIILHRCPITQERIFDALMRFSFPSSPHSTLSSYFLDKMTALRTTAEHGAFSVGVSRVLLGMWSRCLQEGSGAHCFQVMDEALNLIQKTVDINTIPAAMKRDGGERTEDIPTIVCLQIMQDIALASIGEEVYIKRFWKQIRLDFPIICMHPGQPLEVIRRMASILCTSVMNDSFGPITSSNQRGNEEFLLEAVTKPLEMTPKMPSREREGAGAGGSGGGYGAMQVLDVRREILQFLGCICGTESGMLAMARHDNAVSRVAIRVADEVDQCYDWRLGESARLDFINFAVRLLHGIITSHPDEPNGKLSQHHKHLVSMTRIAFSEGMAQEAGLESDVIDCAFALLENMITPDEAVALESMFNS